MTGSPAGSARPGAKRGTTPGTTGSTAGSTAGSTTGTTVRTTKERGDAAEQLALEHLERHGLKLLARNYRCRMGEVDLIMRDGASLVFVEVRLRGKGAFASAAESIDARKQRRIVAAAMHYLMRQPETPCRFDCVLMSTLDAASVEWVKAAFTL